MGDLASVKRLLEMVADPNTADEYGWTPLHSAAREGHVAVVKLLLAKGGDPNIKNEDGTTPLQLAVYFDYGEIVEIIEKAFADKQSNKK